MTLIISSLVGALSCIRWTCVQLLKADLHFSLMMKEVIVLTVCKSNEIHPLRTDSSRCGMNTVSSWWRGTAPATRWTCSASPPWSTQTTMPASARWTSSSSPPWTIQASTLPSTPPSATSWICSYSWPRSYSSIYNFHLRSNWLRLNVLGYCKHLKCRTGAFTHVTQHNIVITEYLYGINSH